MKNNSEPNQYYRDVDLDTDLDREATIIPFPERPKTSEPKQDAEEAVYKFDYVMINQHVSMLFDLAKGLPGKFVVLTLTGDKTDPPYEIAHFSADGGPNEIERIAAHIRSFCPSFRVHPDHKVREPWTMPDGRIKTWPSDYRCKPLNIYVPWALFNANMEHWKKGSEKEVLVSLAGVIDLDCDKGDSPDLPLKASGRLTTSPGNYQDFFVYPQPLTLAEAKPVVLALHRMTFKEADPDAKGDSTTKDVSHIWRVPGTLNFPNAAKIERRRAQGISTEPFPVHWVHQEGGLIAPEMIIAAAPPELPRSHRKTRPGASPEHDLIDEAMLNAEGIRLASALAALNPDVLPKVNPPATLRSFWLEVGMALKDWDEVRGLKLFDDWSERSKHYDLDELEAKWDSFNRDSKTISSIFAWAIGEGWVAPKPSIDTSWADLDDITPQAPGLEAPKTEAGQQGIYEAFLAELAGWPKERESEIPEWVVGKLLSARLSPALEDQILKEAGKRFGGKRAIVKMLKKARAESRKAGNDPQQDAGISTEDFYAYMPMHQYIYVPTRELWPASSINSRLGEDVNMWIDEHRPVEQMTWAPGKNRVIENTLMDDGGWIPKDGVSCFNLYRPPVIIQGDAALAKRWIDHVNFVYPNSADHIIRWCARRVQYPGIKINHALVIGGAPGIGKDTLLEPVKQAVGPWNFSEVNAHQVMGRFNGFLKSVILRISEVKDLGEISRYEFYNHMKNLTAAPPDVLRVDEKNLREHSIINCTGIVYTTNHRTDSLYLTSDDRRHYVDWSELKQEDFAPGYWPELWGWFENGGYGHVAAYLRELDLSYFNPKAPPLKTPAFWDMVDAGRAPEDGELADLIDMAGNPKAFTINDIRPGAGNSEIGEWLDDRKNRRQIPHRLEASIRNDCAADGRWKIRGTRQTVYALAELSLHERLTAAKGLMEVAQKKADPFAGTGFHRYSSKSNNAFNKMGFESC